MVITVHCPSCETAFPVDTNKVPERGVNARCSVCGGIFRVERPAAPAPPPPPPPPAPEPSAPSVHEVPPPAPPEEEPAADSTPAEGPSERRWGGKPTSTTAEAADDAGPTLDAEPRDTPPPSDWVFEREEDIDPSSIDIEPVGTMEDELAEASRDPSLDRRDEVFEVQPAFEGGTVDVDRDDAIETDRAALQGMDFGPPDAPVGEAPATWDEPPIEATPEPSRPPEPPALPAPAVGAFTFGKRDPAERARRLARVLVSDMIMYNPERHERALAAGTLKADFEEEIEKSWKEYVEQIGREAAESSDHWRQALNDVLAKGQEIF